MKHKTKRAQIKNSFVSESQNTECSLTIFARNHSHSYGDEQNNQTVPVGWVAAERGF